MDTRTASILDVLRLPVHGRVVRVAAELRAVRDVVARAVAGDEPAISTRLADAGMSTTAAVHWPL